MKYNFDEFIDRRGTCASKWTDMGVKYGKDDLLPMWVADMDFQAPEEVVQAVKERAAHGVFGYTTRPESYYDAIVSWMERRHNYKIEKDWIEHAPGVIPALNLLVRGLTRPGDKILIQPPVYPPFYEIIKNNGCHVVTSPLKEEQDKYVMDYEHMEQVLAAEPRIKMFILCSPHNPVGRVWSKEELRKVGELCLQYDVMVLSDEIHCDLLLKDNVHVPFTTISPEMEQNSAIFYAPSKTFNLAGLQSSVIIIPNEKIRAVYQQELEDIHLKRSNIFGMVATEAAYNHGDAWLDQLMEYIDGNVDVVMDYVAKIPGIKAFRPEGTYLVWLDCRELGIKAADLKQFMVDKAGVALNDGTPFGKEGEGFQRINLACPRASVEEAMQRIEKAVKNR